jgi:hypothetical protein
MERENVSFFASAGAKLREGGESRRALSLSLSLFVPEKLR